MRHDAADAERVAMFDHVVEAFAGLTSGGWLRRPCPRCQEADGKEDVKESLGYNTKTGGFNCFKCGMKGSLPFVWQKKLELAEEGDRPAFEEAPKVLELPIGYVPIFTEPGESMPGFDPARSYVVRPKAEKGRGMTWETAEAMGIGAALYGKLAGRVIIPILDYENPELPWRGWVARDYTGSSFLPYRYASGMNREGLLFNESALWVETEDPVFVVEGVFDTTILFPDAVACMGKPLESHIPKFQRARRPVVCCLDGDAWEESWALSMTLRHLGLKSGSIRLPPRTDPDERSREWLTKAAQDSLSQ